MRQKERLIHDCDPGQDDAIALMLNLASPRFEMAGVTVVGGNVKVEKCAANARKILGLCGYSDVPVYKGAEKPLKRNLVTLEDVFGVSGMAGGDDLPDPGPQDQNRGAVDYLIDTLSDASRPIFICATAPLTNIALALQREPSIARSIKKLVIMGGCVFPEPLHGKMGNFDIQGTQGGKAEYNFAMDPEAANIVFSSAIRRISLVGLNVTQKILFNSKWKKALYDLTNPVARKAADILSAIGPEDVAYYADLRQSPDDPVRAVHDAVAAVYLDKPEIFDVKNTPLKIVTDQPPAIAGQSLPAETGNPVEVAIDCDVDEVFSEIVTRLSAYSVLNRPATSRISL